MLLDEKGQKIDVAMLLLFFFSPVRLEHSVHCSVTEGPKKVSSK